MLFEVSAAPLFVAEIGSRKQRRKSSSFPIGFVGGFELASRERHWSNIVSFGHHGDIVYTELSGRLLVDLDEESQVVRRPARHNCSSRHAAANICC
jgi:hypothetical protein